MGRNRDPCWKHAKDLSTSTKASFQCNYCLYNFRGGASRIKAHLSGEGNCGIRQCPSVPRHVVEMFSRRKRAFFDVENENMNSLLLRNTRPRVFEDKKEKAWADHKLVAFLTVSNIHPERVNSRTFRDLIMAVAQHGSDYELPDSRTLFALKDDYIDYMHNYVAKVKASLADAGCTVLVTLDRLYTYSLSGLVYGHVKIYQDTRYSTISTYVDSIGSRKVLQIFFDDFPIDFTDVGEQLRNGYPWMKVGYSPTFALGRFFNCLLGLQSLGVILKAASQIAKETDNCWICFRVDNDHIFPCFDDYDWEGASDAAKMLSAIWRVKQLLNYRAEGQTFRVGDSNFADYENFRVDHMTRNCEKFWDQAKEWTSILHPLIEALFLLTNRWCPPLGYLYQIMERIRDAFLECRLIDEDDTKILIEKFQEFRDTVSHPIYAAASLLNPAYVYRERLDKHGELKRGIDFVQCHLVEEDERVAFRNEFQRYHMKDQKIFKTTAKLALESYHPVRWWKCFGDSVPTLQKYAIQILSQPCHSPDFLDLESKCRLEVDCSFDSNSDQAWLMEYHGTIETEKLRPIDFNNVDLPEWLDEYSTVDAFPTELECLYLRLPHLTKCPFCQKYPAEWSGL